jgi:hypothetical protein
VHGSARGGLDVQAAPEVVVGRTTVGSSPERCAGRRLELGDEAIVRAEAGDELPADVDVALGLGLDDEAIAGGVDRGAVVGRRTAERERPAMAEVRAVRRDHHVGQARERERTTADVDDGAALAHREEVAAPVDRDPAQAEIAGWVDEGGRDVARPAGAGVGARDIEADSATAGSHDEDHGAHPVDLTPGARAIEVLPGVRRDLHLDLALAAARRQEARAG